MTITQLFTEERAVSPVIGVILMVAITVILAAVIGTFVLGIAPSEDPAPSAQITMSNDDGENNTVQLRHNGGSTLDLNDFTLLVDGSTQNESMTRSSFSAGERYVVTLADNQTESGEVALRHDPSGALISRAMLNFE